MIIYTNSFTLHKTWRDHNFVNGDVIDFALKMLRPVNITAKHVLFDASKIVLVEEDMHKVTEFLYSISNELEFTYVQHPDEVYFLVTVHPMDYASIEQMLY
jgi:hypothetical protein